MVTRFPAGMNCAQMVFGGCLGQTLDVWLRVWPASCWQEAPATHPYRRGRSCDRDQRRKDSRDGVKSEQKMYRHYTGFPGGLREESFRKLLTAGRTAVGQEAILGMLPKNSWAGPWQKN